MAPRFIPCIRPKSITIEIDRVRQLQLGTFEYTVDQLVDHHIDLSIFNSHYHNARRGRPALHPKILLKIVIIAYSRGIITSRRIAAAVGISPAPRVHDLRHLTISLLAKGGLGEQLTAAYIGYHGTEMVRP